MHESESQRERKPTAAFILSLLAGLWMLATRGMIVGFGWHMAMGSHWLWRHPMIHGRGDFIPILWLWPWLSIIVAIVVLVGAGMIYSKPAKAQGWGTVILIASGLNLIVGMGGFFPSLLGIIGGILAIAWRP